MFAGNYPPSQKVSPEMLYPEARITMHMMKLCLPWVIIANQCNMMMWAIDNA